MKQNEMKQNVMILVIVALIVAILRIVRYFEIISVGHVITAVFFGIFIGSMVVVLKNGFIFLKNSEQKRGDSGKSLLIFSIVAVVSLILTCILATIFN